MSEQEIYETESVEVVLHSGDADLQSLVATAKQYPRSVSKFAKEVGDLSCMDQETATECLYALRRGGKVIEGPSVRFAEIVAYAWGNSRVDAEVTEEGDTFLVAQGTFYDVERNVAVRKRVRRRITDSKGRRYNDDMIATTGNAATSIAFRNAVFAGVPRALWKSLYEKARLASLGKGGTLTVKRQAMLDHFAKMGITPEQIFALLEIDGLPDIREDQLITMRGMMNAIKAGELTVEDAFNDRATIGDTPDLNARLKGKAGESE